MKKVLITIAAVLTLMSCSKEEQVQPSIEDNYNLSIVDDYNLVSMDTFVNEEFELTEQYRCTDTWTFTANEDIIINKYDRETCEFKYQSQNTYTATEDTITIGNTVYQLNQYSGGMSLIETLSNGYKLMLNFEIK